MFEKKNKKQKKRKMFEVLTLKRRRNNYWSVCVCVCDRETMRQKY